MLASARAIVNTVVFILFLLRAFSISRSQSHLAAGRQETR